MRGNVPTGMPVKGMEKTAKEKDTDGPSVPLNMVERVRVNPSCFICHDSNTLILLQRKVNQPKVVDPGGF